MVLFKETVRLKRLTPALKTILDALYTIDEQGIAEFPKDIVITSGNDSQSHSAKSRHYSDEALDVRSKNFKDNNAKAHFILKLQSLLGIKFTILFESKGTANEHFHVQVKKGETFP